VCDDTFVGIEDHKVKTGLNIFPNPSRDGFNISAEQAGTLVFYDMLGNQVDSLPIRDHGKTVSWIPDPKAKGTILVRLLSEDKEILATEKLIISPN
jgi:hypothetical protein